MKAESQLYSNFYTALILKLAGVVVLLGSLVDYVVLAVPGNFLDGAWVANLITNWVDRGFIPMLGIALLLIGIWLDRHAGTDAHRPSKTLTPALLVAVLLGFVFLVAAPLYFNSSRLASAAATRNVNTDAARTEQQIELQLQQRRALVEAVLAEPARQAALAEELKKPTLAAQEKAELEQLQQLIEQAKKDPQAIARQEEEARQTAKAAITEELKNSQQQVGGQVWQARVRVMLSSLMLSGGYFAIAYTGFAPVGGRKQLRPKGMQQLKIQKTKRKKK